ncbi:Non-classical phosphatidylinositol transfer protein (PITP) [Saxophila tyrrhenica]|uniref:Phosphatidylinositol transfer protein SFH5 n=1 Tax=Saxophila tyrrhenica TaxID=1690608 RepID=A0AAV9P8J8_9PEZI|nr:Non-classical phosphatidylinositol transfer protein (PITP) [Saxophila tyrrhenica]
MASPDWSNLPKDHTLSKFADELPSVLQDADYNEMYGVELSPPAEDKPAPHTTLIILQKFLRANLNDVPKARQQLLDALKWRKSYNPLASKDEVFDASKFATLGYVTTIKGVKDTPSEEDVAVFNIYGAAAKDPKKTFGDTDAFVRWRVALMELTIERLGLGEADKVIPDYGQGPDPYQAIQVHDYLSVSFFRQPAEVKASSSKIIDMFQKYVHPPFLRVSTSLHRHRYYPETVSYKYFVNVPLVMQWMMGTMKLLMSKDSIQKMTWLTYGSQLHNYVGDDVPREYGGNSAPLARKAQTPSYGDLEKAASGGVMAAGEPAGEA